MSDTASVVTVSNRDDEVPGPQERRRLFIMGVESRTADLLVGNQVEERSPQDASDVESGDDIGGHSYVEVENDPISTSQVPEPAVTNQMDRFSARFDWLASPDLDFLFTQRPCLMKSFPGFTTRTFSALDDANLPRVEVVLEPAPFASPQASNGGKDSEGSIAAKSRIVFLW